MGAVLLASLVLVLLRPTAGVIVHCALLAYAIAIDLTRVQPEFLSMAVLLIGTLPARGPLLVARAHLIALWFYAGVSKLPGSPFLDSVATTLIERIPGIALEAPIPGVGSAIALVEIGIGIGAMIPRTRPAAGLLGAALSIGILLGLSPLGVDFNPAVQPWNLALAVASLVLIYRWRPEGGGVSLPARAAAVTLLGYPSLFYLGLVHPYLSHVLYSGFQPKATICEPGDEGDCRLPLLDSYAELEVPFPPEPPLFVRYFEATCGPGEVLTIEDPRRAAPEVRTCPAP